MVYKWKTPGYFNVKPEIAAKEFEKLEQTVGLTAENLVTYSEPENAPLHNCFEWNDKKAAANYRKIQARHMIANLVCLVPTDDGAEKETRAFVMLEPKTEHSTYENTVHVLEVSEKRTALLNLALAELKRFKAKYETLQELAAVFEAIDMVL